MKSKFLMNNIWIDFHSSSNNYKNILVFFDVCNINIVTTMKIDFNNIDIKFHGQGNSSNLLEYISNNTNDPDLIIRFLNYFLINIIKVSYSNDNKINYYIKHDIEWQNMTFAIKNPNVSTTTTTTIAPTTTTTTEAQTTTTTTEAPTPTDITFTVTTEVGVNFNSTLVYTTQNDNFVVDWGDGSIENYTNDSKKKGGYAIFPSHTYVDAGTYNGSISIPADNAIYFSFNCQYITEIAFPEIPSLTTLDIGNTNITSLDISNLTGLNILYCNNNQQLTILDISMLTGLTYLDCNNNQQLTTLDISMLTGLIYLNCQGNQLTSLNVTNNPNLTYLNCNGVPFTELIISGTQLTSLSLSNNYNLTNLTLIDNAQLTDLSINNIPLTTLIIDNSQLSYIDLSTNTNLTDLTINNNNQLSYLICKNLQLSGLTVNNNINLYSLDCQGNYLTSLDINNNNNLGYCYCNDNQLTALDLSNNLNIYNLYCNNNQLTVLDVSNNTNLGSLDCDNNKLTTLNISNNANLYYLGCGNNQLTTLDVSNNNNFNELYCYNNKLTVEAVNTILDNLISFNNTRGYYFDCQNQDPAITPDNDKLLALSQIWITVLPAPIEPTVVLFTLTTNSTGSTWTPTQINNSGTLHWEVGGVVNYSFDGNIPTFDFSAEGDKYIIVSGIASELTLIQLNSLNITELDVSGCIDLNNLSCESNQLTTLDLTTNTGLTNLDYYNNQLTALDLTTNTGLIYLYCGNNQLTALDLTTNTSLTNLYCSYNQLTTLDVANNIYLHTLICQSNHLTVEAVNTILDNLIDFNNKNGSYFDCQNQDPAITPDNTKLIALDAIWATVLPAPTAKVFFTFTTNSTSSGWTTNIISMYGGILHWEVSGAVNYSFDGNHPTFDFSAVGDKYIVVSSLSISFINYLNHLDLSYLNITELDVSGFNNLTYLDCYSNQLTTLDISNNNQLTSFSCYNNNLTVEAVNTVLDDLIGFNIAGSYFNCTSQDPAITPDNAKLIALDAIWTTVLPAPIPEPQVLFTLTTNSVSSGWLPSQITNSGTLHWEVSGAVSYSVDENTPTFDFSTVGDKYIVVSGFPSELTLIQLNSLNITDLDVSGCTDLTTLNCYNNQLTALDVSNNGILSTLNCNSNQITVLDIGNNINLGYFNCSNNQLTALDVNNNTNIYFFNCSNNILTTLDVSNNNYLTYLFCNNNYLTVEVVNIVLDELINFNNTSGQYFNCTNQDPTITPDNAKLLALDAIWSTVLPAPIISTTTTTTAALTTTTTTTAPTPTVLFTLTTTSTGSTWTSGYIDKKGSTLHWEVSLNGNPIYTVDENKPTFNFSSYIGDKIINVSSIDNNLLYLNLYELNITSLDISNSIDLVNIGCQNNQISNLDVSNNIKLIGLYCDNNQISILNVSTNTELTDLNCSTNKLVNLDLSNNSKLTTLFSPFNNLTKVSVDLMLDNLIIFNNSGHTFNVLDQTPAITPDNNKLIELTALWTIVLPLPSIPVVLFTLTTNSTSTGWTSSITNSGTLHWEVSGAATYSIDENQPTFDFSIEGDKYIVVSGFPSELTLIQLNSLNITELDVSGCTDLTTLNCYNNQLTALDVSANTGLTFLNCGSNQLTALDVNTCLALGQLFCDFNYLTVLNVNNNTNLYFLKCNNNQLITLDISNNNYLTYLFCNNNNLTIEAVNTVLDDLIGFHIAGSYFNCTTQHPLITPDNNKLLALSEIWTTVLPAPTSNFSTYYVSNAGSDSNDGLSHETSWQSIAKVNSSTFNAGDKIYFNRGDIWREQLKFPSSGELGNPIIISDYGTGEKVIFSNPILTASWADIGGGIYTAPSGIGSSYAIVWEDNIPITKATSSALSDGQWFYGSTTTYYKPTSGTPSDHIISYARLYGGTGNYSAGINVSDLSYITITGLQFIGCAEGITSWDTGAGTNTIEVCYCDFYNSQDGVLLMPDINHNTNALIHNNYFKWCHNAVRLYCTLATTMSTETLSQNKNCKIYLNEMDECGTIDGTTHWAIGYGTDYEAIGLNNIQDCEVYDNYIHGGYQIGVNVWNIADQYSRNNLIYRNHIKSNNYTPIAFDSNPLSIGFSGNWVYDNIFENAGTAFSFAFRQGLSEVGMNYFVNNTCIGTYAGVKLYTNYNNAIYLTIKNNIFYDLGTYGFRCDGNPTNLVSDYNIYYQHTSNPYYAYFNAVWRTLTEMQALGYEVHSTLNVDPVFVSSTDFHLQAGSPAINAGTDMGLTTDYDGNPIVGVPDIGAYETV